MIFPVATIIANLSCTLTLEPGDVIITGAMSRLPVGVVGLGRIAKEHLCVLKPRSAAWRRPRFS